MWTRPADVTRAMIALLVGLSGCTGAAVDSPISAPPKIEDSQRTDEGQKKLLPIGRDDEVAQGCFTAAAQAVTTGTTCSLRNAKACAARCSRGETDACHTYGDAVAPTAPDCAAKVWSLACARDQLPSCKAFADARLAAGAPLVEVLQLLRKACDGSNAAACTTLGRAMSEDESHSNVEALDMLERACDLGDGDGCAYAGEQHGSANGTPLDRVKAADLAKRGCELGASKACIDLSIHFFHGRGVSQNAAEARKLLDKICRLDADPLTGRACFELAILQGVGIGSTVQQTIPELFKRACDNKHYAACTWVARDHYAAARYGEAIALTTSMIDEHPTFWLPRYVRGRALLATADAEKAADDFVVLCERRGDWPYCPLWLFVARGRAGDDGTADLQQHAATSSKVDWPMPIVELLLGQSTPTALLREAKHDDSQRQLEQECEAHYYIGQHHLIAGQAKKATAAFQKSLATGVSSFIEYDAAKAELLQLKNTP